MIHSNKLPLLKNYRWEEGDQYFSFLFFFVENMCFRHPYKYNEYAFNKRDVIWQSFDTSFETLEHSISLFKSEVA